MSHNITVIIYNDDGEQEEHKLPAKNEVCDRCEGFGTHTNPSIDGNGITESEMAEILHEDPEFLNNYMGGMYDVGCFACHGNKVVLVPDEEACSAEKMKVLQTWYDQQSEIAEEREAEMRYQRMEDGGW